jgi:hypothetical protein
MDTLSRSTRCDRTRFSVKANATSAANTNPFPTCRKLPHSQRSLGPPNTADPEHRVSTAPRISHCAVRLDAPIAVKKSSGGEPLAVVGCEGVVALPSAFEPRDGHDRDPEVVGDDG